MDSEKETSKFSNNNQKLIKNENFKYMIKLFIILIVSFNLIDIIINLIIFNFSKKSNVKFENMFLKFKNDTNKAIYGLKKSMKIKEFNEVINEEYRQKQNRFCNNISSYLNQDFENKIKLAKVFFNNISYIMYIYKENDIVSNSIYKEYSYEKKETYNIIDGINFYSKKKDLINKDIYIIDVGGNI
jgi:hypothetical protein